MSAFSSCTNLASVTIPDSVTSIANNAFAYCSSLMGVYFKGNAPSVRGSLFLGDPKATVYCLPGTTGWGVFSMLTGMLTTLWFLPEPLILDSGTSFGVKSNRFGFIISWATNIPVIVVANTTLANPTRSPISTNALTDGSAYFSDPQWTHYPHRFYRLRSP